MTNDTKIDALAVADALFNGRTTSANIALACETLRTQHSDLEVKDVQLAGAHERAQLLLTAKEKWRLRATDAEAQLSSIGAGGVEPALWQFQDHDGSWHNFMSEKHKRDTIAAGYTVRALYAADSPAPAAVAVPAPGHDCCNSWFMSLPEGRQAALRDDKWMLAHAAFDAGRATLAAAPAQAVAVPNDAVRNAIKELREKADECLSQAPSSIGVFAGLGGAAALRDLANCFERATGNTPAQEHATQLAGQGAPVGYLRNENSGKACFDPLFLCGATVPATGINGAIYRPVFDAAPAQVQDATRDADFEAVRKVLCKLPKYSFLVDSRGNLRRSEDASGNWVEFDAVHKLFDPVAVDAARAAQGGAA